MKDVVAMWMKAKTTDNMIRRSCNETGRRLIMQAIFIQIERT
jgi:hypothetical protein